jgi:hypothetical protein
MKADMVGLAVVFTIGITGCHTPPVRPKSAIVRELQAAGSGNISQSNVAGIGMWFATQPQPVKRHFYEECVAATAKADSTWNATDEGKACEAVRSSCIWNGCQPIQPIKPIGQSTIRQPWEHPEQTRR